MNVRKLLRYLAIPLLMLLIAVAGWNWLLHTEPGARWVIDRLQSATGGQLSVARVSGDLGGGAGLERLAWDDGVNRVTIERLSLAIDLDLLPPAVQLGMLEAAQVDVFTGEPSEPAEAADPAALISSLRLPLPLEVGDARIVAARLHQPGEASVELFDRLEMAGRLHDSLELNHLRLDRGNERVRLDGFLGLSTPFPVVLQLETEGVATLQARLAGSLERAQLGVESTVPLVTVDGELRDLLQDPEWDLAITSQQLDWPPASDAPIASLNDLDARTRGRLSAWQLDLGGQLSGADMPDATVAIRGSGNESSFQLAQLDLAGNDVELRAEGMAAWHDHPEVSLDLDLQRLNPANWLDGWQVDEPLAGEAELYWSERRVEARRFDFHLAGHPARVTGEAVYDLDSGISEGVFSWTELRWPLSGEPAQLASRSGRVSLSGQPDDWQVDGQLDLQGGQLPPGRLRLEGKGGLDFAALTIREGDILGGSISGALEFSTAGAQPFSVQLSLAGIDITPLAPEWPGILTTDLSAAGGLKPLSVDLGIRHLDGTLRSYPLSASGGLKLHDGQLSAHGLEVRSQDSYLELDGSLDEASGLGARLDLPSLSVFAPQLAGSLSGHASLSLAEGTPRLLLDLNGDGLVAGPLRIANLTARTPGERVELSLGDLEIEGNDITSLAISTESRDPLRSLIIGAETGEAMLDLALQGSVSDWTDPLTSGWTGQLSRFTIDQQDVFNLRLEAPANLLARSEAFTLENVCLIGNREARLCTDASWGAPQRIEMQAQLTDLPVELLDLILETDLQFSQMLSGDLQWSQDDKGSRNGHLRIDLSPGDIRFIDDEEAVLHTGPGLFSFSVEDGRVSGGELDLNLTGAGEIDLDFSAPDLRQGMDSEVDGRAVIRLGDLSSLGEFFPVFDKIGGAIDVDLAIAGKLGNPVFSGGATLRNGVVEHPASGFRFSDIDLSGTVSETDQSALTGRFRAGEGSGELNLDISFENMLSPTFALSLTGKQLTVVDVPDLKVVADPDLTLDWRNDVLTVGGRIYVPEVRLSPSYLPQSSIGESEDVVVVAGELPQQPDPSLQDRGIGIQGELEVEIGENFTVDLDLAQAQVTGGALFRWNNDLIPMADGNFDVTGEINAFGQHLRVTRGRIGFPDIPADNPHLNIRAERDIYGNSQIQRAGLMVAGTVRRPVIEAYTVPATNKHRAQTLLVTGSDFNFEQGVGAVDVGTYVLPRLYLSYGIGVFEDGNVISARYDIGRGFGIKATSGQRETGVDLNYRFER